MRLLVLLLLLSGCAHFGFPDENAAWSWCFDFKHRGKDQPPFCGTKKDCEFFNYQMKNSPQHEHLEVTSGCYYNEE